MSDTAENATATFTTTTDVAIHLTDRQERIYRLLPIVPTILSTIASGTIMYLVWASGFRTPYKRILFGLSAADILNAILVSAGQFMIPPSEDDPDAIWTFGNHTTCTILGTLRQLSTVMLFYNAMLSYYYLLIIRFGIRETTFARRCEPYMHAMAILIPVVTATIGASLDMYHLAPHLGPVCWLSDYPPGCEENNGECRHKIIGFFFSDIWILFTFMSLVVNNLVIYYHVRRQINRVRHHSMSSESQAKRKREVATQAFLYVAALFGTCIWTMVLFNMNRANNPISKNPSKLFPFIILNGLFLPSTGIFNLCIYLRPRYLKTRKDYPRQTRYWAIRRALYGEAVRVVITTHKDISDSDKNHVVVVVPATEMSFNSAEKSARSQSMVAAAAPAAGNRGSIHDQLEEEDSVWATNNDDSESPGPMDTHSDLPTWEAPVQPQENEETTSVIDESDADLSTT